MKEMMKMMMREMVREMMTCSKGRYSSSSTGGSSGPGLQQGKCKVEIIMMRTMITLTMIMLTMITLTMITMMMMITMMVIIMMMTKLGLVRQYII